MTTSYDLPEETRGDQVAGPIAREVGRLRDEIERLNTFADHHIARLAPVLAPDEPTAASEDLAIAARPSPLAHELDGLVDMMRSVMQRLDRAHQRLEL